MTSDVDEPRPLLANDSTSSYTHEDSQRLVSHRDSHRRRAQRYANNTSSSQLQYSHGPNTSTPLRTVWLRRIISLLLFVTLSTLLFKFGGHGQGHKLPQSPQHQIKQPLRLVKHSELSHHPYCGLDPLSPKEWPYIPTINKTYTIVGVMAFIRHGDRFFSNSGSCWPGQNNTKYSCSTTHNSVPGSSLSEKIDTHTHRLFRKRYMRGHNEYSGNCMMGQLSARGLKQEESLGKIFNKAYVPSLLSATLNAEEVFFRSDDMPRTILSAESVIQGMFPINDVNVSSGLQIVDLFTMDLSRETEVENAHECPGLTTYIEEAKKHHDYIKHVNSVQIPLQNELAHIVGLEPDVIDIRHLFDCIAVSACRHTEMPANITKNLFDRLSGNAVYTHNFALNLPNGKKGLRLAVGPLIREISVSLNEMASSVTANKTNGLSKIKKFQLYSGHDTGPILSLLVALGLLSDSDNAHWPPYASYIVIELVQNSNNHQHYVRIVYNGIVMKIADCSDLICEFSIFQNIIQALIPDTSECPNIFARPP